MTRSLYISLIIAWLTFISPSWAVEPVLDIDKACVEMVPLYEAIPANETYVTSLVRRDSDGAIFGAACGKTTLSLFRFDLRTSEVTRLDCFDALWWDDPVVAVGPEGDLYLGSSRVWDKQFVFERPKERAATPDGKYLRRDTIAAPNETNQDAPGMPIRHYSKEGHFLNEIPLPEALAKDGTGALLVSSDGKTLYGISSPGGHLFTICLETGSAKDLGEVAPFPNQHHTRRIPKAFMEGKDGNVYLSGSVNPTTGDHGDDGVMGAILRLVPSTGELTTLDVRLPAIEGRHRFAAIDAVCRLNDGSYLGGTTDGYLFHFDPATEALEGFGKPLRQQNIPGLALGPEGLVYGAGGEPGGLPRLFAFDLQTRQTFLGYPTTGVTEGFPSLFGEIGAVVAASDGTLICGERERRGYLLVYRPRPAFPVYSKTFSANDFQQCTRDRFVDLTPDAKGFQLARTFLLSDTMTRSSKIQDPLGYTRYAKKTFYLHSSCKDAEILFYGGGGTADNPMLIVINGRRTFHVQEPEKMLTGGWDRITVPMEDLRVGKNEIVFGENGYLVVDTDEPEGNSAKSFDQAVSWQSDALGPDDNLEGEYAVRIRVHGYPQKGIVNSPVIDLAESALNAEDAGKRIPPVLDIRDIHLKAEMEKPPQTSIRFEVRTGKSPEYHPRDWSPWLEPSAIEGYPMRRYLQWRATLASNDMNVTPRLTNVTVQISAETSGGNSKTIEIASGPDRQESVSSYPFTYADPHHPRMRHLREKYNLEKIVEPGKTETEKLALLRQWVREQWEGWDPGKYAYCPQWDALEVLELAPAKLGLGMCTHYAAVFVECAAALGYPARCVIIDHHCLAETWSNDYQKWMLQDVGRIPNHFVSFQFEHQGVPLNALEVHQRYLKGDATDMRVVPDPPFGQEEFWKQNLSIYCRFAIPFRNDHLYNPLPQELEHGNSQYHWDGYLWWTDSLNPKYPEYSFNTCRPEDFYWTLNKAFVHLQDTATPGTISVQLSGNIPNFKTFLVKFGDGEWTTCGGDLSWSLKSGENILQAKAVNTMGHEGIVNKVVVKYTP